VQTGAIDLPHPAPSAAGQIRTLVLHRASVRDGLPTSRAPPNLPAGLLLPLMRTPHHCPATAAVAALVAMVSVSAGGAAQAQCRALMPIGGSGVPTVEKRISPDRLVGRTNWNTDFAVDRDFRSYRVNFQSVSTGRGTFPLAVFLRFTDGSHLQVVNQNLTLDPQQQRRLGPFPAVAGKRTNKVNVRVGSSTMPGSTGFSYRVSVEGCN
jgi:hypothetical protein